MKYLILPLVLFLASCNATIATRNHQDLRTALMQYTEDQIMDNLIRGYRKLPIMHFDYTTLSAEATLEVGASTSNGTTGKYTTEVGPTRALVKAAGEITKPETYGFTPKQTDKIILGMQPVTKSNEVYEAYEKFLEDGGLVAQKSPPADEQVHIKRKVGDWYYYVPTEKAEEFFNLSLVASVKRGGPATATSGSPTGKQAAPSVSQKKSIPEALKSSSVSPQNVPSSIDELKEEIKQLRIEQSE